MCILLRSFLLLPWFRLVNTEQLRKIIAIYCFLVAYWRLDILLKWFQWIYILHWIAWCIHYWWYHILLLRFNCFFHGYWWRHSALLCHKPVASGSKARLRFLVRVSISCRKWGFWLNSGFNNPLLHGSCFIYIH